MVKSILNIRTYFRSRKENEMGIKNFGEVDTGLVRGARPSAEGYESLWDNKFDVVINLIDYSVEKGGDSALARDQENATQAGLEYHNIPFRDDQKPNPENIRKFLKLLQEAFDKDQQVFFGCKGNRHRGSLLGAIYLVLMFDYNKKSAWKSQALNYGYYDKILFGRNHKPIRDYFFNDFKREDFLDVINHVEN